MTFTPTILTNTPPVVVAPISNNPNATYQGFLNSLNGGFVFYAINNIQKQSNVSNQLKQPIQVVHTDMNGNQNITTKATALSDFQNNPYSLLEDWSNDNVVIDDKTVFNFTMLPNATLEMFIDAPPFYIQNIAAKL